MIREKEIINALFEVVEELEARVTGANMMVPRLQGLSWIEVCEEGKKLFERLED